jgi:spermidine synthase
MTKRRTTREQRPLSASTTHFPLIIGMFFCSGAASLVYEVAWFRRLELVFGVSTFAIGAVVTAFMLGLAAGSYWAGLAKSVRRRPLVAYAVLEALVAGYAFLFPQLIGAVEQFYSLVFSLPQGSFVSLSALRFVLSLLVLLPATFCMGATLPALAKVISRDHSDAPRRIGWLYSANTLGAVAGTLLAGFWALEHLGIRGTIWLAAALNLAVACGAGLVARRSVSDDATPDPNASSALADVRQEPASPARYARAIVGVVGLASMALQLVWTRALIFYVHNSTYAFSAILAVYLLGLGLGAAVG